jgi:hypothetical protein
VADDFEFENEIGGVPSSELINAIVAKLVSLTDRGHTAAGKAAISIIREIESSNAAKTHQMKLDEMIRLKAWDQASEYLGYVGADLADLISVLGENTDDVAYERGRTKWRIAKIAIQRRREELKDDTK